MTDMTADHAAWAADLMERRRQEYASYSPEFWRPAVGVKDRHPDFLATLIGHERVIALRTEHAFTRTGARR